MSRRASESLAITSVIELSHYASEDKVNISLPVKVFEKLHRIHELIDEEDLRVSPELLLHVLVGFLLHRRNQNRKVHLQLKNVRKNQF